MQLIYAQLNCSAIGLRQASLNHIIFPDLSRN